MTGCGPHTEVALCGHDRIYNMVRTRVFAKFNKHMGLHDFRRAGTTFLAMDAPEKIGLIPGMLQHASPDIGQQVYNLCTDPCRRADATRHILQKLAAGSVLSSKKRGLTSCAL